MERRRVGNVDVVALVDNVMPYAATAVYPEAGAALDRFRGYFDAEGRVPLNFGCFLLVDGSRSVLVDTGWGPEFQGRLMAELAAAKVDPALIDAIVFTHLHGDHTGWNLDRATGKPLFPKARYHVPRADWEHYGNATPPPDSFVRDVVPLEAMGCMELIEGEHTLAPSLTAIPTPGHTPGHTSIVISSGGERGFILGDVVISKADVEDPDLVNTFDWDRGIARQTRLKILERLVREGGLVGASHLPAPGLGRFVAKGAGAAWAEDRG
ncbi:MAG: MBL fold metallo-hydrolase [Chloroflexi bacterium]|nr:MBL fold metallo-hydrolase [Chloroflexota bacterium]